MPALLSLPDYPSPSTTSPVPRSPLTTPRPLQPHLRVGKDWGAAALERCSHPPGCHLRPRSSRRTALVWTADGLRGADELSRGHRTLLLMGTGRMELRHSEPSWTLERAALKSDDRFLRLVGSGGEGLLAEENMTGRGGCWTLWEANAPSGCGAGTHRSVRQGPVGRRVGTGPGHGLCSAGFRTPHHPETGGHMSLPTPPVPETPRT